VRVLEQYDTKLERRKLHFFRICTELAALYLGRRLEIFESRGFLLGLAVAIYHYLSRRYARVILLNLARTIPTSRIPTQTKRRF
jgi:hypothetical protein